MRNGSMQGCQNVLQLKNELLTNLFNVCGNVGECQLFM